jgi:hypothetical protein
MVGVRCPSPPSGEWPGAEPDRRGLSFEGPRGVGAATIESLPARLLGPAGSDSGRPQEACDRPVSPSKLTAILTATGAD